MVISCEQKIRIGSQTFIPTSYGLDFDFAATHCEMQGLYLASIHNHTVLNQLYQHVKGCGSGYGHRFQVGLILTGDQGRWVDGTVLTQQLITDLFHDGWIPSYNGHDSACQQYPTFSTDQYAGGPELTVSSMTTCYMDHPFFCSNVGKLWTGLVHGTTEVDHAVGWKAWMVLTGLFCTILLLYCLVSVLLRRCSGAENDTQMAATQTTQTSGPITNVPPPPESIPMFTSQYGQQIQQIQCGQGMAPEAPHVPPYYEEQPPPYEEFEQPPTVQTQPLDGAHKQLTASAISETML